MSRVYETAPVGGPPQDAYLNAVVAIDTDLDPHELLARCQRSRSAPSACAPSGGARAPSTSTSCSSTTGASTTATSTVPHPRMWERGFVLAPLRDVAPDLVAADATWEGVRDAGVALEIPPDA